MDILDINQPKQTKQIKLEFNLRYNDKEYQVNLELSEEKIQITLNLELSLTKWCQTFSIEQLYKIHKIFFVCDSIESAYDYLAEAFKNNSFEIIMDGQMINLTFSQTQLNVKVNYQIKLQQVEVNSQEAILTLNQTMVDIQKKQIQLEQKLVHLECTEKFERQEKVISQLQTKIEQLENIILDIQKENQNQKKETINIQQNISTLQEQNLNCKYSNLIYNRDISSIGQWIHEGKKQMKLELLYCATRDGFKTSTFQQKCQNISPTLIVVQSTLDKRFGGFTDLLWQNDCTYKQSNPNKSFVFSLDSNKIYRSNEQDCKNVIYCHSTYFAFGGGHDFFIRDDSNLSKNQSSNPQSYGKNEGIDNKSLAGEQTFLTKEIEVFQVILS